MKKARWEELVIEWGKQEFEKLEYAEDVSVEDVDRAIEDRAEFLANEEAESYEGRANHWDVEELKDEIKSGHIDNLYTNITDYAKKTNIEILPQ